jgi:low temperature requirement protein LtrA
VQTPDSPCTEVKPTVEAGEPEAAAERSTTPVELLWDLVFVFAVTLVTTLLSHDLSWSGLGRAMLVLALMWWAWSARVRSRRHAVAATYALVRLLHLGLYIDASRRGNASLAAIAGFAVTVAIGMALLVGGSFASGTLRIILWVAAAAIDYAGPAWLTQERLRGLQRVAAAHFAKRYSMFIIICLGESIVSIGLGANGHALTAERLRPSHSHCSSRSDSGGRTSTGSRQRPRQGSLRTATR